MEALSHEIALLTNSMLWTIVDTMTTPRQDHNIHYLPLILYTTRQHEFLNLRRITSHASHCEAVGLFIHWRGWTAETDFKNLQENGFCEKLFRRRFWGMGDG